MPIDIHRPIRILTQNFIAFSESHSDNDFQFITKKIILEYGKIKLVDYHTFIFSYGDIIINFFEDIFEDLNIFY